MAKYNFSDEERSGIWEAHDRRCCFCRRLLPWEDMNADHLIPESLEEKPEELEKVKRNLSLPKDFKLRKKRMRSLFFCFPNFSARLYFPTMDIVRA